MILLNTSIKALEPLESGELKIQGKASTPSTDRARDIILADAWAKGGIDNYRKNPILLFNHNYDEPIGKVTNLSLNQNIQVGPDLNLEKFQVGFRTKGIFFVEIT